MLIAIDNLKDVKKLIGHDLVYVFDNESAEELLKTKLHCIHYTQVKRVDINLTKYDLKCKKKANITDDDLFDLPPIKENKYAIIIPNCNNAKYLKKCIDSVLDQTYKNLDLIIVDDMSTDTSVDIIKEYKDKRLHLIQNKRKRYNGGSRNVGIDYALNNLDFDYFAFLDSDDWWKHDKVLETINEEIDGYEMAVIGAEMLYNDGVHYKTTNSWANYEEFYISEGTKTIWCTAWCRIIRKDKIKYFNEDTLMEDRNWSYRVADDLDFNKVINIKEVMYVWNRMNSNSVTKVRNPIWNASAWCHIGHQLQFISEMKHTEFKPILEKRVQHCIEEANKGVYTQY